MSDGPLSPRAVGLRNSCLGALSRRASRPAPTPRDLGKIRNDIGLRDAWLWWSKLDTPTEAVQAVRVWPTRRPPRQWPSMLVTLLATGAWLFVRG